MKTLIKTSLPPSLKRGGSCDLGIILLQRGGNDFRVNVLASEAEAGEQSGIARALV